MIDFLIHYKGGSVSHHADLSGVADEEATSVTLQGVELPDFRDTKDFQRTVGYKAAYLRHVEAETDVEYYGYEDRHGIIAAYVLSGAESFGRISNFVHVSAGRYIGKFETPKDFIQHFFTNADKEWIFESVDWTPELINEFLRGFRSHGGYYFEKSQH